MIKKIIGLAALGLLSIGVFPVEASSKSRWSSYIGVNTTAPDVCISDGPTNLRLEPRFGDNVRATVITNSCGEALDIENDFILYEAYFPAVNDTRKYWVHYTQLRDSVPSDYREYRRSPFYWDSSVNRCRSRYTGRFVRSSFCY